MSFDLLTIFGAGLLTFLTPCVLPLIPIYLAALTGGSITNLDNKGRGRLLGRAVLFSVGFILVFTAMGFTASSIGTFLSDHKVTMQALGAIIVMIFALKFLHIIRIPFLDRVIKADDAKFSTKFGVLNAFVMGIVFAAGWSPCVGPVLGSILTYTASAAASPSQGAVFLTIYGLGFALPLLITAAFAEAGMRLIGKVSAHLPKIEKGIGIILLFVAGMLALDVAQAVSYTATTSESSISANEFLMPGTQKGLPVMVELYKEDCTVCQKMKPTIEKITSQCDKKGVHVRAIDIGKPENRHLIGKFNLIGVPTFVFLDKNGAETARLVGEQTEDNLKQTISALRGEPCPGVAMIPPGEDRSSTRPQENCNI